MTTPHDTRLTLTTGHGVPMPSAHFLDNAPLYPSCPPYNHPLHRPSILSSPKPSTRLPTHDPSFPFTTSKNVLQFQLVLPRFTTHMVLRDEMAGKRMEANRNEM